MKQKWTCIVVATGLALSWIISTIVLANDIPRITKEELRGMLNNPKVVIIDVRANVDWLGSSLKVKGAIREDPRKVNAWMDKYSKDKTLVFYCA